ncbi:hypothetical protein [Robertkochia solimangrovi]|uniref:hypothetical protein n=1 Tax=Robertkochia solimangrovi TaxID=2213046 RepID=UPI00117DB098|nr:hypothetical protein [Robertkochia solimangrovi]TRZ43180.1 hypothetical protein DMZ48_10835 [Robertkochia solimangrovi]
MDIPENLSRGRLIIEIPTTKAPVFIRGIYIILILVMSSIPFLIMNAVAMDIIDPHFSLLLIFAFFWFYSFQIFRHLVWNTYGKEIITLTSEEISYLPDYKFFRGSEQKISSSPLEIALITEPEEIHRSTLTISSAEDTISTVIRSETERITAIVKTIQEFYRIPEKKK